VSAGDDARSRSRAPSTRSSGPNRQTRHAPFPSETVIRSLFRNRRTRSRWWRSPAFSSGRSRLSTNAWARAEAGSIAFMSSAERRADLREETGVGRRDRVAAQLGQSTQQLLLVRAHVLRRVDDDLHDEVTAAATFDVGDAASPQAEQSTGLRAARQHKILFAV